jgi:iron complex outermembrane recepter protein
MSFAVSKISLRVSERQKQHRLKSVLLAGMSALALAAPALAGTGDGAASSNQVTVAASQPDGAAPAATDSTETVLVTATRRKEPLQKVPLAVSVVDGDTAASQNLNNINNISTVVPSLNFRDGTSNKDQGLFIRGIGTVTTSPGAEPSVSTVVDNVVLVRPGQATLGLIDADQIEVLRGPQGTLFGKNASAGVVNITTKQPTDDFEGYADLSYYEGNEEIARAGISGPLVDGKIDGLASILVGNYDGNVRNVFLDDASVNGYTRYGTRDKLAFTPSDDLKTVLSFDYLYTYSTEVSDFVGTNTSYPGGVVTPDPAIAAVLAPVVVGPDNTQINANQPTYIIDNNLGFSSETDWNFLPGYTLTSITAWRNWHNNQIVDLDQTSAVAAVKQQKDHGVLDFNQYSQELRVASPKGEFIEYVAGLYYLHWDDIETYSRTDTAPGGTVNTGVAHYSVLNDNYSLFGEATINFTDHFRAIAGLRVVGDHLSAEHERTSTAADSGIAASSPLYNNQTNQVGYADRLGLQYDLSDNVTSYFTYSRGYKGPAYNVFFNMVPATQGAPLAPETSDSLEAGVKSQFFDDKATLDLAVFHTEYYNFQANFPNLIGGTVVTNLVNAGSVRTQGVEGDFAADVTQALTLHGAVAYTDAYVDKTNIVGRDWPIADEPLPFTPTWKLDLSANYHVPLNSRFALDLGTDGRWQTKVQYDLSESPDTIQSAFGIWNANLTLRDSEENWSLSFLVKNILDQHYATYLQSAGATAAPGTPGYVTRWVPRDDHRYVGVDLRKTFD